MSNQILHNLGDAIFADIDNNPFLNELYDDILYNYAITKFNLTDKRQMREIDVVSALRFADLLSKSTHAMNRDKHKMWAQEIIILLYSLYPDNPDVLGNDYDVYYLNQRNAKLELQDTINKYYLSMLLKFEPVKKKLTGISRGVRQANISNKDILNLMVPIPPIELQNQFAAFVEQIDKSKVAVQKALDEAQLLFDSLMQKYFG